MTRRALSYVALVLVLVVAGANARVLFGGTWDDVRYHADVAPPRLAAADAMQAGALPAWWDGTGLGVPLAGEPSHGAMYPPTWIASSPRAFDWLAIVHLIWAAIGIAVWARLRSDKPPRHRPWIGGASEPAAVVVALLAASSGVFMSAALRGALPAIAHLPWIGAAACWLAEAQTRTARARAAVALGALIGLVGLSGIAGGLIDALVVALVIAVRPHRTGNHHGDAASSDRRSRVRDPYLVYLAAALFGGLAIAAAQWVPALLHLGTPHAGAEVTGLPLARLVELVLPLSSGSPDPDRAIPALAGDRAWAPSLFVGAPLLALAAVRVPRRRVLAIIGTFVALALLVGRGGWPAWLGAPEIHLAALVVVLAAHAGSGVDALLEGERRGLLALAAGVGCSVIALAALGVLRSRHPEASSAIDPGLINGALGVACGAGAVALVWRGMRAPPLVLALLVLPSFGSHPAVAPIADRAIVEVPPAWADLATRVASPRRLYRPERMIELPMSKTPVTTPIDAPGDPIERETLDDAISTFAGTSAWRWGITAARSDDPARPAIHDATWQAASSGGGVLLDRFGIALAILPETLIVPRHFTALGRRGRWALVELPVAPAASVMRGWLRAVAPHDAFALLFPIAADGGAHGHAGSSRTGPDPMRGTTILGEPGDAKASTEPPLPCTIDDWSAGSIDLRCTSDAAGYAVVSSTPSPGWSVTVDDAPTPWVTADVLRRAVAFPAGTHRVHWTFTAPGLSVGLAIAGIGLALLIALGLASRR